MRLSFIYKVCRSCPEHQRCENLIGNAEELPCSIEIHLAAEECHSKDREANKEPVLQRLLIKLEDADAGILTLTFVPAEGT